MPSVVDILQELEGTDEVEVEVASVMRESWSTAVAEDCLSMPEG